MHAEASTVSVATTLDKCEGSHWNFPPTLTVPKVSKEKDETYTYKLVGRVYSTSFKAFPYHTRILPDGRRVFTHDGIKNARAARLIPGSTITLYLAGTHHGTTTVMYVFKGGQAASERRYKSCILGLAGQGFQLVDSKNRFYQFQISQVETLLRYEHNQPPWDFHLSPDGRQNTFDMWSNYGEAGKLH